MKTNLISYPVIAILTLISVLWLSAVTLDRADADVPNRLLDQTELLEAVS